VRKRKWQQLQPEQSEFFSLQISPKFKKEPRIQQMTNTCLNTKPTSKFGRLHVLHQSQGAFPRIPLNKGYFRCAVTTHACQTEGIPGLGQGTLFSEINDLHAVLNAINEADFAPHTVPPPERCPLFICAPTTVGACERFLT
jgi:hypothetical protein